MCKFIINFCAEKVINRCELDIFPVIEHGEVFCMSIAVSDKNIKYDSAKKIILSGSSETEFFDEVKTVGNIWTTFIFIFLFRIDTEQLTEVFLMQTVDSSVNDLPVKTGYAVI